MTLLVNLTPEEIENYQDLKQELKGIWKLRRVTVVPVIIGALGTISKDIEKWLTAREWCHMPFRIIAESALILGTARILRSLRRTPKVTRGDLMFKEDSSKPYRCFV